MTKALAMSARRGPLNRVLYKSFGGPRTDRRRLSEVKPQKLWNIVLNRRARDTLEGRQKPVFSKTFRSLREAGLEDPFEITPEIEAHVKGLFDRYNPKTQLEKAILLFRSIINTQRFFAVEGVRYSGLKETEGGLEIFPNGDLNAPLRKKYSSLLPKQIMAAPVEQRIAVCLEYSHLLVVFLRVAGIKAQTKAQTKGEFNHAYVIALLEGGKYRLDIAYLLFDKTTNGARTDAKSITLHYINKGNILCDQGKPTEAIRYYDKALEIDPDHALAWNNKGEILADQGKPAEAIRCFDKAPGINPDDAEAWYNKGTELLIQWKLITALKCFWRAFWLDLKWLFRNE